ncbi:MAG: hypothetical protein WC637_00180 [Victivallales bacterium]
MNEGAKVIQVIQTTLLRRGKGIAPDDPVRIITQYWTLDGKLLVEHDPYPGHTEWEKP